MKYKTKSIVSCIVAISMIMVTSTALAENASDNENIYDDVEEGGVKQHDMFEFEAFIKHDTIKDGTAPFDSDNEAGNDSGEHNGIIRSFDTATYPIKITINPKQSDKLENIKLKVSGYLENGVTDGRVNASFAVGGSENIQNETVSFEQEYTVERTGNSVMIPVAINVAGAKHGTKLTPRLKVQVMSVDGEDISSDDVFQEFNDLPTLTVSSKVSIGVALRNAGGGDVGYLSRYLSHIPSDDDYIINKVGIAFYAKKLPNKNDIRGTTMPDGKINFTLNVDGYVYWDKTKATVPLDFENKDEPVRLFDLQSIDWNASTYIGNKNTIMEGISYYKRTGYSGVPQSKMSNINDMAVVEREKGYKVWDSGDYHVEQVNTDNPNISQIKGTIDNYVIGSTFPYQESPTDLRVVWGPDYKIFSTRNLNFATPTDYRAGGKFNKENETNNVYYNVTAIIHSYEDSDGNIHEVNESSNTYRYHQRNGIGSMSSSLKFWSERGVELGTRSPGNAFAPFGDEAILKGQNVQASYRVANHNANMDGGMITIIKWNIDSFELTKADANRVYLQYLQAKTRVWRGKTGIGQMGAFDVKLGVPKNTDMSFRAYLTYEKDDYDWYSTYDEAIRHGKIGAIQYDITDGMDVGSTMVLGHVPLNVLSNDIIGSLNRNGTPNIASQITYGYYDKARTLEVKLLDSRWSSYTKYDDDGFITSLQKPAGGSVSFNTLGVINGNASTQITSDKNTYYSSDTMKWSVKSSIVTPETVSTDGVGGRVTIRQELPRGLMYKVNSAKIGNRQVEPEVVENSDGTTSLVFEVLLSTNSLLVEDITYETVVDPLQIQDGVQADFEVKSIISSDIDTRAEKFRTDSQTINIIKVGMVGILETIDKSHGGKNSDYTVTLRPYTTIEDEKEVAGLTHLPSNDDGIGSKFDGQVDLTDIDLQVNRAHDKETVDIYLNKNYVYDDKPNRIDVTKDDWYLYTGDPDELQGAKSIYFIVNGIMTNRDDIRINLTIQTSDNNFGNEYLNETVINSATDYNLSPISNRVRYEIRPDWELSVERVQIYTNKKDEGLPVQVRINQWVNPIADPDVVENYEFDLVLYDTEADEPVAVASKKIKQSELDPETPLLIEPNKLTGIDKGDFRNYEVRIEIKDEDVDRIWAREPKLDTNGYVASEKVFTNDDIVDGKIEHDDEEFVVMTERELNNPIVPYHETYRLTDLDIYSTPQVTKAGYGYQFTGDVVYENPIYNVVDAQFKHHFGDENGLKTSTDAEFITDNDLLDKTIEYYNEDGSTSVVTPHSVVDTSVNTHKMDYEMEKIYIKRGSGETFTQSQLGESPSPNEYIDSSMIADSRYQYKNMLYVPVWAKTGVTHNIGFKSSDVLGSNHVSFDFKGKVEVEASMFNHIDSKTTQKDEIMIHQKRGE